MNLVPGDRIPNFQLPAADGRSRVFYFEVTGKPLLLLASKASPEVTGRYLAAITGRRSDVAGLGGEIQAVSADLAQTSDFGGPHYQDQDGKLLDHLLSAGGGETVWLIADANQRLVGAVSAQDPDKAAGEAVDALKTHINRPMAPVQTLSYGAPVIMLDNMLGPDIRQELIDAWRADNREGLVNDGFSNAPDASVKKNREHEVVDPDLKRRVAMTLGPRIAGELEKACNFIQPLRFEAFTVLSYTDDREDFFAAHRDNIRSTQKRRFAMSLNLNDGFEGGELMFPEYGDHKYLPGAGGAAIFSCALLHQALPVTKGQRWVMVTFMCDP